MVLFSRQMDAERDAAPRTFVRRHLNEVRPAIVETYPAAHRFAERNAPLVERRLLERQRFLCAGIARNRAGLVAPENRGCARLHSATASEKRMTLTVHHSGRAIDERMVWVMGDHTDRVDYRPDDDDGWILTIRRDIPPLFVTRR